MKRSTFNRVLALLPFTVATPSLAFASTLPAQSDFVSRTRAATRSLLHLNGYRDEDLDLLCVSTHETEFVHTDGGPYLIELFETLTGDAEPTVLEITSSRGTSYIPVGVRMFDGRFQRCFSVALIPSTAALAIRLHGGRRLHAHTLHVYQIAT
jgi:hypothetical protein